jgi:hypothetical protein
MGRMCLVFYVALTAAALLAAGSAIMVAFHSLGSSAWAEELTRNLNVQWIGELIAGPGWLPMLQILPVLAGVFAISLMVDLFLLGGALHLFCARERFSLGAFFAGCGRNFAALIRVGLVSLIFYGAAAWLWFGLSSLGDRFWGRGSEAAPLVYWSWLSAAAGLCFFVCINLAFDYARIRVAALERPKAWRCAWDALRFVRANCWPTVSLYLGLWLIVLLGAALYCGVARLLSAPAAGAVILLFGVRQFAAFGKVALRLLFYSAQFELFDALTPKPAAMEPAPLPEPARAEPSADPAAAPENDAEPLQLL